MELLKAICSTLFLCAVLGERILINFVIDNLLAIARTAVLQQGKATIQIDDLQHEWKYRWHFLKLKGSMKCTDGKLKNLSTIRRTGDAYYKTEGNRMGISFSLGLEELSMSYKCKIRAKHIVDLKQTIKVKVNYDSVVGDISLIRTGDNCFVSVDRLQLDRLDGVKIHSGGGVFHKVEDRLLKAVYNHCHKSLLKNASNELQKIASVHLQNHNVCKDIHGLNGTVSNIDAM